MWNTWLNEALESLWRISHLAANPLVDIMGLASDKTSSYHRATALREAILSSALALESAGREGEFEILNRAYGLEGEAQRSFRITAARPSRYELAAQAGMTIEAYEQAMAAAVESLGDILLRSHQSLDGFGVNRLGLLSRTMAEKRLG